MSYFKGVLGFPSVENEDFYPLIARRLRIVFLCPSDRTSHLSVGTRNCCA